MSTLKEVESCPDTPERLRQRSIDKKCNENPPCQGEPLMYHCVKHNTSFVEVCAPGVMITGNAKMNRRFTSL